MASSAYYVKRLLDRKVSFYSRGLKKIDLEKHVHIVKKLGEGGFGKVFLANDRKTGGRMALKVTEKNRTTQRSFLWEFSILCILSIHPNIIRCYGNAFTTTDHFGFIQELAPFGDLLSMIIPNVGIPEDAVKRCSVQISSALEFMSEKGLVHMDVKPENVLVFDRDCHSIKLTDFGLAKVKGTVIRGKCGTASYMAPEMCQIDTSDGMVVGGSLDVWAFGVVICCLLTGELPWEDAIPDDEKYQGFVDWQNNVKSDNPPEALTKVASGIQRMISDLLAIDHTKRSRTTVVLKYTKESWKAESPGLSTRQKDEDAIEIYSSLESDEPLCEASHQSSKSIVSSFSSTSGQLIIDTSESQSEMTPEPPKDDMEEALVIFDDEFSLHIGAEIHIE